MDTSGKGGVVKHVVGLCSPNAVSVKAFKKPTPEEAAHHFLWRIRKRCPGQESLASSIDPIMRIARSAVHDLIPEAEWQRRYEEINAFEAGLVEHGTTVVKCLLHISYATQRERLLARLDDPTKRWKFSEGDITERAYWAASGRIRRHAQALLPRPPPWYVAERPEVVPELGRRAIARGDAP